MKKFEKENAIIMYKYKCLNPIAEYRTEIYLQKIIQMIDDLDKDADALLVRSAAMHDIGVARNLKG